MSLDRFLRSMDETALLAAASKGVLIRAKKDVDAGRISRVGPDELNAGGETVKLSAQSLAAARCTCPATGICRHILASIVFLQNTQMKDDTAQDPPPEKAEATPVMSDPALIEAFAGADWARALAHVENGRIDASAGTVTVTFPETKEHVAFPAGQALKQAIYKGPRESRRRMAVAAAALVLVRAGGAEIPENHTAAKPVADPETLKRARKAIEDAAVALAAGTLDAARERLFNAAISTRAEAIPRLAAEMRGLSRRMDEEALRRVDETPEALLLGLSRTHALTRALEKAPNDPALTGTLSRSFQPCGPREIGFLGAEWWQNPSGAKGLSAIFTDLTSGTFHRAVHARAAGTDLNFAPQEHWRTPLWGLSAPQNMGRERIVLPDAALSYDGGLGLSQKAGWGEGDFSIEDLLACGAATGDFARLDAMAEAQIGIGLRKQGAEALAIVVPDRVHPAVYDDHQQKTLWLWEDLNGLRLALSWHNNANVAPHLTAISPKARAALIALRPGGPDARLLSVRLDKDPARSVQFERLPQMGKSGKFLERIKKKTRDALALTTGLSAPLPEQHADPLCRLLDRSVEGILSGLVAGSGLPSVITGEYGSLGLSYFKQLEENWRTQATPDSALKLAYALSTAYDRLKIV